MGQFLAGLESPSRIAMIGDMDKRLSLTFPIALVGILVACGPSEKDQQAARLHEQEIARLRLQPAVQLELSSLTSLLDADMDKARRKLKVDMEAAASHEDMDEFARIMRANLADLSSACDTTNAKLDALEAFLIRNEAHGQSLDFASVRADITSRRSKIQAAKTEVGKSIAGFRDLKTNVNSREEWQSLHVSVAKGDILIITPKGSWQIGDFAGSCDAKGMHDPSVQKYALEPGRQVGALLIRTGKTPIGAGALAIKIADEGGDVEARCNDREYLNNHGAISVHVVAFSPVPSAF